MLKCIRFCRPPFSYLGASALWWMFLEVQLGPPAQGRGAQRWAAKLRSSLCAPFLRPPRSRTQRFDSFFFLRGFSALETYIENIVFRPRMLKNGPQL